VAQAVGQCLLDNPVGRQIGAGAELGGRTGHRQLDRQTRLADLARVLANVPLQKINYDLAGTIGWSQQVGLVARLYHALPPAQRASTAILAGNYGEAGAIDRYGPAAGLPPAFSGSNSIWFWGPPPARDSSVIAVNMDPALLRRLFRHVRQVAVYRNGLQVSDDEQGAVIDEATGLRQPWRTVWPSLRDFS
jgi:hypothetical protein